MPSTHRLRRIAAPMLAWSVAVAGLLAADRDDALAAGFADPPTAYRPWVWAHWLHGNVDRACITRELEAIQRVGLGGLTMFDVAQPGIPAGPHGYLSPGWQDLFAHEMAEARRLGLEVMSHLGPGYSGSGGPWIPAERASQTITETTIRIIGGRRFTGVLPKPTANGDWYRDVAVIAVDETEAQASPHIADLDMKRLVWLNYIRWKGAASAPLGATVAPELCIPRPRVQVISGSMDREGNLDWDAPPGTWTIFRFGHTWSGQKTLPATPEGEGPECDKLDPRGIRLHFERVMQRLIDLGGPASGTNFHSFFADSWEAGGQNWTERMPEEFLRRRGYDPIPFLPVMVGRVIQDLETSERFLYDLRQTVSELATEHYWAELKRLCNARGMRFASQPYITTGNDLDAAGHLDEPMGEFWSAGIGSVDYRRTVKLAASAADLHGRLRVGTEAFTANVSERWRSHPALLKPLADQILCLGANRFQVHRFAMQRFPALRPGMMMGGWGQQYDSTQTWWEWSKPWHDYLGRCQYLLSQGPIVADVLAVVPEEPLWRFEPLSLQGYDYDACGPQRFRDIVVKPGGRTGIPDGPDYALLVVQHDGRMTVERARQLRDLVQNGATILGEPPRATPGMDVSGTADAEVQSIAKALWGTDRETDRRVGQGRVLRGMTPEAALARIDLKPDTDLPKGLTWIHRRRGTTDWWFIANPTDKPISGTATFRIRERRAERWDPETGRITPQPVQEEAGRSTTRLDLAAGSSVFFVFSPGTPDAAPAPVAPTPGTSTTLSGPWTLSFPPGSGAPSEVALDRLASWSESSEAGIRGFSGTATYRTTFTIAPGTQRVALDLGRVAVMARVRVNGTDQGILWRPPFRVTLDHALRPGANVLEVEVVNLWINRLITDEALPSSGQRDAKNGRLQAWPEWVLKGTADPTGRRSFVTFPLWKKGEPLVESGLIGPVTLQELP